MSFTIHKKLRESLAAIRKDSYTPSHIAVMECLAYRINDKTGVCFPSVQTIADESYLSERHVRKVLSQLEQDRIVEIVRRTRKSNHYRLHVNVNNRQINATERADYPHNSATPSPTLTAQKPGEQAQTAADITLEAPLTYNLNQSLNPIREVTTSSVKENAPLREMSPSDSLLSETSFQTDESVNQKAKTSSDVTSLYSLLMEKVKSACTEPSTRDAKDLNEAIAAYGFADLFQTIEWVYRRKNKFWREKLKFATHPCSMFCRGLPTMMEQINEDEEKASRNAAERRVRS